MTIAPAIAGEKPASVADTPLAAVNRFIAAQAAYDRDELDHLISEDFVEISPLGAVDQRAAFLGFYDPRRKTAKSVEIGGTQQLVRAGRHDAFVSMTLTFKLDGIIRPGTVRAGYALRRQGGRWRLTTAQYTPLRAPASYCDAGTAMTGHAAATVEPPAPEARSISDTQRYEVVPLSIIDEGDYFLVGDPTTGEFYQFPRLAIEVLSLVKDGLSTESIATRLHDRGDNVDVADLIDTLSSLGMIHPRTADREPPTTRPTSPTDILSVSPSGSFRFAILGGKAIFSPAGWLFYAMVVGGATIAAIARPDLLPRSSALAFDKHLSATMLALLVLHGAAVAVHEASHMLAAARHGVRTKLGFSNRLWSIVAEADLSGILALPRRQRYLPLAAGMAADFLVVGICTLTLAAFLEPGSTSFGATLLRALALQILLTVAWQFNFYLRTDVYYLLCTYARQPRLDLDAQEYRSVLAHRLSGGMLGHASERGGTFGPMVRVFALLWGVGRLIAIAALCFIFIPTIVHYIVLAAGTFNDPTASIYRKLDTMLFVSCAATLMGIGMAMWATNTVRAWRKTR